MFVETVGNLEKVDLASLSSWWGLLSDVVCLKQLGIYTVWIDGTAPRGGEVEILHRCATECIAIT